MKREKKLSDYKSHSKSIQKGLGISCNKRKKTAKKRWRKLLRRANVARTN